MARAPQWNMYGLVRDNARRTHADGQDCEWPSLPSSSSAPSEPERSGSLFFPGTPTSATSSSHQHQSLPLPTGFIESALPPSSTAPHPPLQTANGLHHPADAYSMPPITPHVQRPAESTHVDDAWLMDLIGGGPGLGTAALGTGTRGRLWNHGVAQDHSVTAQDHNVTKGADGSSGQRRAQHQASHFGPALELQGVEAAGGGGVNRGIDDLWDPAMWSTLFESPQDFVSFHTMQKARSCFWPN